MARFVITVDFHLHAGTLEPFLILIKENAHKSLTEEPGCDRFDVLIEKGAPDHIVLYEIYKDRAAFDCPPEVAPLCGIQHGFATLRKGQEGRGIRICQRRRKKQGLVLFHPAPFPVQSASSDYPGMGSNAECGATRFDNKGGRGCRCWIL